MRRRSRPAELHRTWDGRGLNRQPTPYPFGYYSHLDELLRPYRNARINNGAYNNDSYYRHVRPCYLPRPKENSRPKRRAFSNYQRKIDSHNERINRRPAIPKRVRFLLPGEPRIDVDDDLARNMEMLGLDEPVEGRGGEGRCKTCGQTIR